MRVTFLNENIGGHATMHGAIREALESRPQVRPHFIDVPPRGLARRIVGARIPGLGRLDLDAQLLRAQFALSIEARRRLRSSQQSYDVLHVYTQHAALMVTDLLRSSPSVVTTDATGQQGARLLPYREPTWFTPRQDLMRRRIENRVFDAATFVVAKSEWAAASLRGRYGIPEHKLTVIPLGVIVPELDRVEERTGLPIVTFVGTSLQRKGGYRLLRVFRSALRGRCELHLVTRDDVVEEPGVHVHRDLSSADPRLASLLRETAVFALPTEMDTFGYASLEAMALGVPVVSTRLAAIPEIVADGVTGILVDADDAQLARAILRLLDDRALRRRMGAAGRQRVLERFNARLTTDALVTVLELAREQRGCTRSPQSRRPQ